MQCLVGLDLIGSDGGAIRFAAWLASGSGSSLAALHVLQSFTLRQVLEHAPLEEIEREADRRARAVVAEHGTQAAWDAIDVTMGDGADDVLARRAAKIGAAVTIIGRRARMDEAALVRLGAVARRMLRRLATATVVVPPDFTPASAGSGPVVLTTDLGPASDGAVRFARALAGALDRQLVVVHTFEDPAAIAAAHMPVFALGPLAERVQAHAEATTRSWAEAHGVLDSPRHLLRGETVGAVLRFSEAQDAAAIVTGSRHASVGARMWRSSVGSGLAAHARCPVAVVPSDWPEPKA